MNTQQIYNVGTTIFYEGDDINRGGFGKITDQVTDYLGELQLEITLEDGRVIYDVRLSDFEAQTVLGNTQSAEFHMVDSWETEVAEWGDVEEEGVSYEQESSVWSYFI